MEKPVHLPQTASDYIDAVIKKMRYRKKIRLEVRQELADHFTDALADCKNDDERQTLAQELIAEFGDAQLLGTLLCRGKKRCRPWWKTACIRLFQAVGIVFVLVLVYLGWFFSGKPVITANYLERMNQQVKPIADDSQNAWPYYKQAAEKYIEPNDKEFDFSPRHLSVEEQPVIRQAISNNQESLELTRQGNQKPYYWQVYRTGENKNQDMITMLMPHLGTYRGLSHLFCWQAILEAEQGNMQNAFDQTLEGYSFGQHLRGPNTTLIEQLVAVAIEAQTTKTIRMLLDENIQGIDAPLLDSIRKRFEEKVAKENFTVSFEAEKLFFYDELHRSFTQSQIGKSHLYIQRVGQIGMVMGGDGSNGFSRWFRFLFTHPDREKTRKTVDRFYDELIRLTAKTPASLRNEGIDIDKRGKEIASNNFLLQVLAPALGKVSPVAYRIQADSYATLTIIAIMQHYKTYNTYPDSLDAMVQAGLMKNLPLDPFSDKPLVYRKTGDGFALYSVGSNFTDDGGVPGADKKNTLWDETGDAVFWPRQVDAQ